MHFRRGLLVLLIVSVLTGYSQDSPPQETKSYTTSWREGDITIDGKLDEAAWDAVEWGGDFVGHEPE